MFSAWIMKNFVKDFLLLPKAFLKEQAGNLTDI